MSILLFHNRLNTLLFKVNSYIYTLNKHVTKSNHLMKSLIFSFLLVLVVSFPSKINGQQKAPEVNPELMAGIIMYDADAAIKKIKVKKEPQKVSVIKAISLYNNQINEIKTFNYITFNNIKSYITKKFNEVQLTKDYRSMEEVRMKVKDMIDPVKEKVKNQKTILNETLEKELSAKQYKNWVKFQKIELKKLQPKAPERQTQSNYSSQRRRQGNRGYGNYGGMNRRY